MTTTVHHPGEHISSVFRAESLRYSQVWEDSRTARSGLALHSGDAIISIGSAGCNVLAMLLSQPRRIVAVDLNPAQVALLELKLAALLTLEHSEFVALLGARDHSDRLALFDRVRPRLTESARRYWDARVIDIEEGILASGRLERYFRHFQIEQLERADRRPIVRALLRAPDRAMQVRLFQALEDTGLQESFGQHFGRESMARGGRHESQLKYVDVPDLGTWFWDRFRYACTELPTRGNFYLEWFLTSRYRDLRCAPWYLRPRHYEAMRALCPRVAVVTGDITQVLRDEPCSFDKANLSDIFEYLSEEETEQALEAVAGGLVRGGRLVYWNLLVTRQRPRSLARRLRPRRSLGERLWMRDRSWFYRAVRVEEVIA